MQSLGKYLPTMSNFHVHTYQSNCAQKEMTVKNIIPKAMEEDLKIIGLTDHTVDSNFWDRTQLIRRELGVLNPEIKVLIGCEADMLSPQKVTIDDKLAKNLDYIAIAPNHYHLCRVQKPRLETPSGYVAHNLSMIEGALNTGFCDVIVHPFLLKKVYRENSTILLELYDRDKLRKILERASAGGVALEFNPSDAMLAPLFYKELCILCRESGVKFAMGNDAHKLSGIGNGVSWKEIRGLGFLCEDFCVPGKGNVISHS